MTRVCARCGKSRPSKSFSSRGATVCKPCYRNPRSHQQVQAGRRWKSLGIKNFTQADYDQLLIAQCGKCAICDNPFEGRNDPAVDHDHETGEVRGLLCFICNRGVGCFRDDPELLIRAASYLRK